LPSWPCEQVSPDPLTADSLLSHPLAVQAGQDTDQPADAQAKSVAAFAAAPENTPEMGVARITAFVRQLAPGQRPREMTIILTEVVARTNELRGIIRDGIHDKVAQSHLLADTVAGNDQAIAALPANTPAEKRHALEQARRQNAATLGDRAEDAQRLCYRLDYTATKARQLAAAIAQQAGADQNGTPQ
jgi:hypothetical protein